MAQEKTKRVTKRREVEEQKALTLLDAVEQIAEQAQNSALSEAFFKKVARPINYIGERLQISDKQAVMLALLTNFYDEWNTLSDLTQYTGCKRLQLLRYAPELNMLRKNRYIRIRASNNSAPALFNGEAYRITNDALHAIQYNEPFYPPKYTGLTIREFFDRLNDLTEQRKKEGLEYSLFVEEVFELINANSTLPFVGEIKSLNLPEEDRILFLWCCDMLVSENDGVIIPSDIHALYDGLHGLSRRQLTALREQQSLLFDRGLLQPINNDGMGQHEAYELTSYVRCELLQGLGVKPSKRDDGRLLSCQSIVSKELFYNPKEERSLTQLSALLEPEQFDNICARLEEKGLRRGFACLFYGAPGTGKTETVLQLARQTGRDLMQVNVAEIKSMWVGESEKNIKALFDRYRRLVKESERAPILFFNEADAIINKRNENAERAVDKMENSMQNIILQEIENLEGILIATTNLTKNMDSAFERRFLYKIEFEKPSAEAKQTIWRSMLPSLSNDEALQLATKYDFTGGQIENITRKQAVDEILTGHSVELNRLIEFCNEERLDQPVHRRRIGF
ncbi:MAG: ATP-binding protein [Alistipes sp.]|nr:ATP-binding protein [Alistipes sp.]